MDLFTKGVENLIETVIQKNPAIKDDEKAIMDALFKLNPDFKTDTMFLSIAPILINIRIHKAQSK
jgi:hypothetical protein